MQVKVRNATSNDPWGPTGTEMQEIASMTFNSSNEFYEIMDMLDKRLNDKGKNWRHVLKALKVLDYCLHEGSELVVTWAHKNLYVIKTLREFIYIDEDGRDVGQNIRVSAKELTSLILDEERLRAERSDRKNWKSRVQGIEDYAESHDRPQERRARPQRAQRADEEDAEYRLAIEASKHQEEEDRKKRQSRGAGAGDNDDDVQKAIKLSMEEEELRRRELEEQNAHSLFDDDPVQIANPTGGYNQGYQQQSQVDWSGNPIDPSMQQQPTGYMGNIYGMQNQQPTGYQNGYQQPGLGAQQTGAFDPYGSQQSQFQPQQTGFNNPYQQQQTPEPLIPSGTNNPWATNTQTMAQAPIQPTPTGSNNPFASTFSRPQNTTPSKPTLATLQEQKTATFNPISNYKPPQAQPPPQKAMDPHQARLNALLASGEGMDTFGNTGDLRIPAQHTAPGTFVNSAGAGANRLTEQQTGTNPFLTSQFTGMPQTTYGGNSSAFGAGHQVPAATGPAGMPNGFGVGVGQQSNNPFGGRPQQQQGGPGDLIQF